MKTYKLIICLHIYCLHTIWYIYIYVLCIYLLYILSLSIAPLTRFLSYIIIHNFIIYPQNLLKSLARTLKVWDMELLPVLAAKPIKYSSLFLRINLKSWRYTPNLGCISTFPLSLHSIDRPKYITFCHS